jgi:hypothetical protein
VAEAEGGGGGGGESEQGREGEPGAGHVVFGIDDGEGVGPEELGDIGPEVGGDEGEAGGGRDVVERAAATGVGMEVDEGEDGGEQNQGPFFEQEPAPGGPFAAVEGIAGAAQGPVVEEEQEGGQDDDDAFGEESEKHERRDEPAAGGGGPFDEAQVGEEGEQEEETAEDILAGGDPGDGFDALGMEGEDGGDEGGGPEGFRQAGEHPEEEGGVEGMEEDIDEMVAKGARAEHFRVEHVRDPQHRQPPLKFAVGAGPAEVFEGKPRHDMGVLGDVVGIVQIDEVEAGGGPEEGEREPRQGESQQQTQRQPVGLEGGTGGSTHGLRQARDSGSGSQYPMCKGPAEGPR